MLAWRTRAAQARRPARPSAARLLVASADDARAASATAPRARPAAARGSSLAEIPQIGQQLILLGWTSRKRRRNPSVDLERNAIVVERTAGLSISPAAPAS